jgi:hypothetical protein
MIGLARPPPPTIRAVRRIGVPCTAMAVALLRQLEQKDITCPAGSLVGDASVVCGIEHGVIDGRHSPESVEGFCCGEFSACPSWRMEKERVEQNKKADSYLDEARKEGAAKKRRLEDVKGDRYERARHLLFGDTEEARRFRARVGLGLKRRGQTVEIERNGR